MNGSNGEWFRTAVGVRQGCLLSPIVFNIFLERIMSDALEEHDGKITIGGRNITNLRLADDIDALAEEKQELEALVESLDKNLHTVFDGDQCGEDQTDDKQRQWHPERDKGKRAEVGYCNKLQMPLSNCF